jgi:hypothetical protein
MRLRPVLAALASFLWPAKNHNPRFQGFEKGGKDDSVLRVALIQGLYEICGSS